MFHLLLMHHVKHPAIFESFPRSACYFVTYLRQHREQTNVSETPASIELLELRFYYGIIMVAQLWFGMCNIQPRLPSCLRREVQ